MLSIRSRDRRSNMRHVSLMIHMMNCFRNTKDINEQVSRKQVFLVDGTSFIRVKSKFIYLRQISDSLIFSLIQVIFPVFLQSKGGEAVASQFILATDANDRIKLMTTHGQYPKQTTLRQLIFSAKMLRFYHKLIMSQNSANSFEGHCARSPKVSTLQSAIVQPPDSPVPLQQKRKKFTAQEDQIILQHVQKHGKMRWNQLPTLLPGRNQRTIRERYTEFLDPDLNRAPFSIHEELQLWLLKSRLKWAWSRISKQMAGRCNRDLKNKFRYLKQDKVERFQRILRMFERPNEELEYFPQMLSQLYNSSIFQEQFKEIIQKYPSPQELTPNNICIFNSNIKEETISTLNQIIFKQQQEWREGEEEEKKQESLRKMIEKSPLGLIGTFSTSFSTPKMCLRPQASLNFRLRKQRECKILLKNIQAQQLLIDNEEQMYDFKQMNIL